MQYGSRTYLLQASALLLFCGIGFFFFRLPIFWWIAGGLFPLLLIPVTGIPILRFWVFLEQQVQRLINTLLLTAVFFGALTPLAFLRRLFQRKPRSKTDSYYQDTPRQWTKKDIENPW